MMAETLRKLLLSTPGTVVVKIGTNVLADAQGNLDQRQIEDLAGQVHRLRETGWRVALVSSGAIGAGVGKLNLGKRPVDLPHLQACAAVGQSALMQLYLEAFARHGVLPAQILLTASDFDHRPRYLNVRHTIQTLFEYDCLPIINENDTVAVAEIKFGDNDRLAAMVANLLQAKLLVLLTNVDGLYSADPKVDPGARIVPEVEVIDGGIAALAGTTRSDLGVGGMKSKLQAAKIATASGCAVLMANGSSAAVLDRLFAGDDLGTLFRPVGEALAAWKRWIGYTAQPKGQLIVDAGAKRAMTEGGKSLLPIGVRKVMGTFGKGDPVSVCDESEVEFARGLANYSTVDAIRIVGCSTEAIRTALGGVPYVELIHRDNLVLLG